MYKPEISIVVPIYNTEQYLPKCIDSILSQTYENFELILVNDGSTDKSLDVCKKYSNKDKRIIIINKSNTGSSHTRNIGIEKAKGKYICFIDSDDWIKNNMLEEYMKIIKNSNCDMIISGMYIDKISKNGDISTVINSYKYSEWNTQDEIKNNIINIFPNALINSSCNKLYKSEIIKSNRVKFNNTNIGEDTLFNLDILKHVTSITVIDKAYYHYMRYPDNVTLTRLIIDDAYDKYLEIHNRMNELFLFWGNLDDTIETKINETMFAQYFATTLKILNSDKKIYTYKVKKEMLNRGLKQQIIIDTFDYSKPFSYKEKIFRFTIKNRLYLLAIILLKLSRMKKN